MIAMLEQEFFTVAEVAKLLKVSPTLSADF